MHVHDHSTNQGDVKISNDYYNHGGYPSTGSLGASATARAEFDAIMAGFDKMPALAGNALELVRVNAGATGLESTNLIDGITIGSVTPAAGTFTTLTATGNVSLGDAVADTLSIGGSVVKNATGNYALPAPSSGITLSLDAINGTLQRSLQAGIISGGTNKPRLEVYHTESTGLTRLDFTSSTGTRAGELAIGGAPFLSVTSGGNTTLAASASGHTLVVNGSTSGVPLFINYGTAAVGYTVFQTAGVSRGFIGVDGGGIIGTGTGNSFGIRSEADLILMAGAAERGRATSAGQWSFSAPSGGATVTITGRTTGSAVDVIAGADARTFSTLVTDFATLMLHGNHGNATANGIGFSSAGGGGAGIAFRRDGAFGTFVDLYANPTGNATSNGASLVATLTALGLSLPIAGYVIDFASGGATQSQINSYNSSGLELLTRHASAALRFYSGNATLALTLTTGGNALFENAALTRPVTGIANSAGTVPVDASASNVHEVSTLTANVTTLAISNPSNGQTISIRFKQDATGGRTVVNPTGSKVSGSVNLTSSAASLLTITYSETDARWEGSWLQLPA